MNLEISWNNLCVDQWEERFSRLLHVPVTQSPAYGRAAAKIYGQRPRYGLITIDGQEAGLVQMMEAGILGNLIHAVIIDCGPCWFDGFGAPAHINAFWAAINAQFPARFGRKRRFIPLCDKKQALEDTGLSHQAGSSYSTINVDLVPDEESLRAGLKKNWRGGLNKAERNALQIEWDDSGRDLAWFLKYYALDKATRGYDGPSVKFLQYLGHSFAANHGMIIGRAIHDGQAVAGVMIFTHGGSATYQAAWCLEQGRETGAHNILLWQAMLRLKENGIRDFDLGGVNEASAQGVKTFKEGLGGAPFTYCGIYH